MAHPGDALIAMANVEKIISTAYQAHQKGDAAKARKLLARRKEPQALHILGLVERKAGNYERAAFLLSKAAAALKKAGQHDHDLSRNQGLVARQRGLADHAERFFRQSVARQPDFLPGWISLGRLLLDLSRWGEALAVYRRAEKLSPDNDDVRYGIGAALLGRGDAEVAEALFSSMIDDAAKAGTPDGYLRYMRGRARLELNDESNGYLDLHRAHAETPSPTTLRTMANVLWMQGRQDELDTLLRESSEQGPLVSTVLAIYRESDDLDSIRELGDKLPHTLRADPDIAASLIWCEIEAGNAIAAKALLTANPASSTERGQPSTPLMDSARIVTALMTGDAAVAQPIIRARRKLEPLGQHWLAYEATALRLTGGEDPERLNSFDAHVRCYEIPTPDGFSSLAEFNRDFAALLGEMHATARHPLDQSVRTGTQTQHNLVTLDQELIRAYLAALADPIEQYLAEIGTSDKMPLTRRNQGRFTIENCWSVNLADGGYHVDHVHPEGWISSAYYVIAEGIGSPETRAGWLRFGMPPFLTDPQLAPSDWIEPRAGLIALFPSYTWHGTVPVADDAPRMTAPLDIVPG